MYTCVTRPFLSMRRGGNARLLQDFTATLLTEVCIDQSALTLKQGSTFALMCFGTEARTHSLMLGFLTQMLLDIIFRIWHSRDSYTKSSQVHEQKKKRAYNQHVLEVENGVFTPLILVWEEKPRSSIRGLLIVCQWRETSQTLWQWDGFIVASILPYYTQSFHALGGQDLPNTIPFKTQTLNWPRKRADWNIN